MRRVRPGEQESRNGTQSEWAFKSRTFVGQIESVDPTNGVIRVRVGGVHESKQANIPLWGLHYDGLNSSWFRYMPETKAYVKCSYGPRNELEVLGYETYGDDVNPDNGQRSGSYEPRVGGYSTLAKFAGSNTNKMRIFRALKPGEFDMRSAGGAGFYATRDGVMTLEAGSRTFGISKPRNEAVGRVGLFSVGDDGVVVTWGDVKRQLPGQALPQTVLPNLASAVLPKEWSVSVQINTPPAGLPVLGVYDANAGDLRDALGVPILHSGTALPTRYRSRAWNPTGLTESLTVEVDVLGNTRVTMNALAVLGGFDIAAPGSPLSGDFLTLKLSARVKADITAPIVNINTTAPADMGITRGEALAVYLSTKLSVLTAFGPSGPAIVPLTPGLEFSQGAKVGV